MYEKLLVCLDGSSLAEQILPYAEAHARCFNTKVTLIQVVVVKVPEIIQGGAVYKEFGEADKKSGDLSKTARSYLTKVASKLREKGIETDIAVIMAPSAGEAIVKFAEENEAGMIAIATHGRTGLREILLGSVAEYVLRNSGLPILMIKPKNL